MSAQMRQGSADSKVLDLLGDLEQQEREHEKDRHSQAVLQFAPDFRFAMPAASGSPGFSEMLEVAIERERQSVLIYQSAADLSGGDFRGILEELAAFEKQHLERLSGIRRRSNR
jgi:rubrerythrin